MMPQSAKVILDSISPDGKRLTTMELRYWRSIHAEIMTHRDRARNAASSRAVPFYKECATCYGGVLPCQRCGDSGTIKKCTYTYVKNDPFIPEFIGAEQKGMQSGEELQGERRENVLRSIERMREFCLEECRIMAMNNCHKSIINRYVEPWSYITVVMTATEWKNFFRLRIHPAAEKHFNQLATMMKAALDASQPTLLQWGGWHMPYLTSNDPAVSMELLKKISAARCARVSYLNHDGKRSIEDDLRLFETLMPPGDVIHSSALEHVATPCAGRSGPYNGWGQMRKEYPNENVEG